MELLLFNPSSILLLENMYFPLDYPIPFRDTHINIPSLRDFLFEVQDSSTIIRNTTLLSWLLYGLRIRHLGISLKLYF